MSSDLPDINQGILKPDLFEKFKQQLQKDFETCSLECGFSKTLVSDYDLILSVISSEIRTISHSPGKLNELLYRIDISEMQIKKLSNQKNETNYETIVAELIIKRILQKVVFKEYFKEK
jgi:hypothetical protein